MGYASLRHCVADLERTGQLVRIGDRDRSIPRSRGDSPAGLRRRRAGHPVRARQGLRISDGQQPVRHARAHSLSLPRHADGGRPARRTEDRPGDISAAPVALRGIAPGGVAHASRSGSAAARCCECQTTIRQLPQLVCWPNDGGAFVTLPQVYTEDASRPGWRHSNLGMYRVQLSGNEYEPDRQVGLHYQIHRGIGVHHAKAIERGRPFRVNVFVGGPPALTLAAVMPLPEGVPEIAFAGALGGRRVRLVNVLDLAGRRPPLLADADFSIIGTVDPEQLLPEGPFGDHLGYYSLAHPFPVLNVERVYHRRDAIWPFTVVGRPPQEDTSFGQFIHELTGPIIPTVLPGVHAVHAVDAAGVHPLLLAIGSERYVPYAERRRPQELLTAANAILGQGQLSLAKYLLIVATRRCSGPRHSRHPGVLPPSARAHRLADRSAFPDLHDDRHARLFRDGAERRLEGGDRRRGTETAGVGTTKFRKTCSCRTGSTSRASPCRACWRFAGRPFKTDGVANDGSATALREVDLSSFPLIVVVDDSEFTARTLNNWLWVTFTRSNPAADISGVGAFTHQKHWGCTGSLVIDARIKPHHAPPLEEDPAVTRRVEALAAPGGPLHGLF